MHMTVTLVRGVVTKTLFQVCFPSLRVGVPPLNLGPTCRPWSSAGTWMGASIARIGGRSGYRQQCRHVSPVMWTDDLTSRAPFGPNSTYAEVGIALMQSPALRQAG